MSIDELKTAWTKYDQRLQATSELNDRIITSMIAERSEKRFENVKRTYRFRFLLLALWFSVSIAVLAGNPFDYRYLWQYTPTVIFAVCLVVIAIILWTLYRKLEAVQISRSNISTALKEIIKVYERPKHFMKIIVYMFLITQVVLFPFSFLPTNAEQMEFWSLIGNKILPIAVNILVLFFAYKLGVFKERNEGKFKADLIELEQLRTISRELDSE